MNNMDLISRSALLELAHNHVGGTVDCNDIARFPSVDAEPVRHGRWKNSKPIYASLNCHFECSACNKAFSAFYSGIGELFNYCPHCGARMDGDERAAD